MLGPPGSLWGSDNLLLPLHSGPWVQPLTQEPVQVQGQAGTRFLVL